MGFSLSNLISYGAGNQTTAVQDASGVSNNAQAQLDKGMAALKSMNPGETLQGEVVAVNGNEVEIKIDENAVVSAKLERSMGIVVGQKMMFEVSGSSDGQIALRALFTNLAQEQLAQNALQAAGIPQNNQSLQMIAGLMQEGMSIDRQSLQSIYHDIVQFPETDQSLILHMHKIGMETTPQNVEQFQALVNYEERVASTVNELIHELPAELKQMAVNGEASKVMAVTQELLGLIAEHEGNLTAETSGTVIPTTEAATGTPEAVLAGKIAEELLPKEGSIVSDSLQHSKAVGENTSNIAEDIPAQNISEEAPAQSAINKALAALEEAMNPQNQVHMLADGDENVIINPQDVTATVVNEESAELSNGDGRLLSGVLTKAEYTELAGLLEKGGFSKETVAMVKDGSIPLNELFQTLKAELATKDVKVAADLWDNKAFTKLMGKELQKAWLLNPSEVENGKNVTEFYNRLNTQVNSIISSMAQSLSESSGLMQSLQQFQENVDFLNHLNQFMPYVQLPLKMNGQSATGDLYVYADKRSLASGKDTVSAALHLDMQYLGHLDVFVKMQDKNVSTEFCLENEATLDFIAEHMDMLSERLERRGYHLSSEMKVKDVPSSIKEDILPASEAKSATMTGNETTIGLYRFDVRA